MEWLLHKALYVFNFLNGYADSKVPPIIEHFSTSKETPLDIGKTARVLVKDPEGGKIINPFTLMSWVAV